MLFVLAIAVLLLMVVAPHLTAACVQAPLHLCERLVTALAAALYNTMGWLQIPLEWISGTSAPAPPGRHQGSASGLDDGKGAPRAAERWGWGRGMWLEWRGGALIIQVIACVCRGGLASAKAFLWACFKIVGAHRG